MEERKVREEVDNWENIGNAAIDNPLLFLILIIKQFAGELYNGAMAFIQTKFIQRNK